MISSNIDLYIIFSYVVLRVNYWYFIVFYVGKLECVLGLVIWMYFYVLRIRVYILRKYKIYYLKFRIYLNLEYWLFN